MDPTTIFCPNGNCPARGQIGQGNIGIHSQKEQRFICHACQKTFSTRTGTVFYRLRTSAETVVLVVTLLAHGVPCKRLSRPLGLTSVLSLRGGLAQAIRARWCMSIWSNNHVTWDRSKPMNSASRNKGASCGWRWP